MDFQSDTVWTLKLDEVIARLFATEHHLGMRGAFAEDGLRATLPKIANLAVLRCFREFTQVRLQGNNVFRS
jgi:hypothetical protein